MTIFLTIKLILGIIFGAAIGYGFYKFIGCYSGACPITSNPWISTIFGAVLGGMLAGIK